MEFSIKDRALDGKSGLHRGRVHQRRAHQAARAGPGFRAPCARRCATCGQRPVDASLPLPACAGGVLSAWRAQGIPEPRPDACRAAAALKDLGAKTRAVPGDLKVGSRPTDWNGATPCSRARSFLPFDELKSRTVADPALDR